MALEYQTDKMRMDSDAKVALIELEDIIARADKEVLAGILATALWIKRHKDKTGYKRLCKPLIETYADKIIYRLSH